MELVRGMTIFAREIDCSSVSLEQSKNCNNFSCRAFRTQIYERMLQ